MTQAELNCAVAEATGESMGTIARSGFVLLRRGPCEREPRVDYDDLLADYPADLAIRRREIFAFPRRDELCTTAA